MMDPQYDAMDIYVPADCTDALREEFLRRAARTDDPTLAARYRQRAKHIRKHKTDSSQVDFATENPTPYARWNKAKSVAIEAATATVIGATTSMLASGAIAAFQNGFAVALRKKSGKEALKDTAKTTATSGLQSGAVGAGGVIIRNVSRNMPVKPLTNANFATAVAGAIVDIGSVVYSYAKGEITPEEAMERLGKTGTSALTGLFLGSGAAALFGGSVGLMVWYVWEDICCPPVSTSPALLYFERHVSVWKSPRELCFCVRLLPSE